jgi:RNA polymerase sigma-70 factor (ECF subfamily)
VATLARVFGDIGLAEDAVQEAFAVAVERWPSDGLPPNPGGWIVTTARRKALDRLRRESTRSGREARAVALIGEPEPESGTEAGSVADDQLRLLFTCCHPALAPEARIALAVDELPLAGYHLYHATRADLLRRLNRAAEAVTAYGQAIALAENAAERAFLTGRRATLSGPAAR